MRLIFNKNDFTSNDTWESLLELAGVDIDMDANDYLEADVIVVYEDVVVED